MEIRRSSTETQPTDKTNRNPATTEGHKKRRLSAETRAKMSEAHKGKKHSAETRAKMSVAQKRQETLRRSQS